MKKYYCKECNKVISYTSFKGKKRCKSCYLKTQKKKGNNNYRHGKCIRPKCIDCDIAIHPQAKRCKKCASKNHSIIMTGRQNPNYGKKRNKETKNKISIKIKNQYKKGRTVWNKGISAKIDNRILGGQNNPAYIHGKSKRKYPSQFCKELKVIILKRDRYTCQKCLIYPTNKLSVHHIDYNKFNNKVTNLITLCRKCNSKVNFNRNYWKKYFKNILRRN